MVLLRRSEEPVIGVRFPGAPQNHYIKWAVMKQTQKWRRLDGTRVRGELADEIRTAIVREKAAGHALKVCIGTDSQVKGAETEFATVIVFIRKGRGGFMYINSEISTRKMTVNSSARRSPSFAPSPIKHCIRPPGQAIG